MFFDSELFSHSSSNPLFVSANLFNNSVEKGESVCDVCMSVLYGCVGVCMYVIVREKVRGRQTLGA